MAYELDLGSKAGRSLAHGLSATLKKAQSRLDEEPTAGIHDARTSLKRARTLLRLAKPKLGRKKYAAAKDLVRDAAHALSDVRDAMVHVTAIDGLVAGASEDDRRALQPLRAELARRRDDMLGACHEERRRAKKAVRRARSRLDGEPTTSDARSIAKALDASYRKAQARLAEARATKHDAHFHALRRSVKDIAYATRFLRPVDPASMRRDERAAKDLADVLGDAHDATMLVAMRFDGDVDPGAVAVLARLARARADELHARALADAERFFAEHPDARCARLLAKLGAALEGREPAAA